MQVAAVSELDRERIRPLAVWTGAGWLEAPERDIAGLPCAAVASSREIYVAERGAAKLFPGDERLTAWGIESYIGAPLIDGQGRAIGLLCVMDPQPLEKATRARTILDAFASRAALELERIQTLRELDEQRAFLRQVLDINPSLIFAKDRDGRFTLVNQAIAEAYGTTIEGLTGKTDADFNPNEEEVAFFRRMDLEVMDTGQERFIPEEPLTDASGRLRWVQTIKRRDRRTTTDRRTRCWVSRPTSRSSSRTREQLLERERERAREGPGRAGQGQAGAGPANASGCDRTGRGQRRP